MKATRHLKSCWLITWEWSGEHARVEDKTRVVALLNYRWTGAKIREFVEQLYAALTYHAWDKAAVANNRRSNPYPAKYGRLGNVEWLEETFCGDNPWLHARRVKNLVVTVEDDGSETVVWEEKPRPNPPTLG